MDQMKNVTAQVTFDPYKTLKVTLDFSTYFVWTECHL